VRAEVGILVAAIAIAGPADRMTDPGGRVPQSCDDLWSVGPMLLAVRHLCDADVHGVIIRDWSG